MRVGCRIQVWTSTDRTSLVQEGKWNFQDCRELGSLHINKKKSKTGASISTNTTNQQ